MEEDSIVTHVVTHVTHEPSIPIPNSQSHANSQPTVSMLAVDRCMLRSPSRESVTTELSMLSVSSAATSEQSRAIRFLNFNPGRSVSPNPDTDTKQIVVNRPAGIPEVEWCDEENDVIRSCAALSAILGLQKSFSTSDISQLSGPTDAFSPESLRTAVSELTLSPAQKNSYLLCQSKLENTSRSCSTWVAVGDVATSQLPSPHGHPSAATSAHFTPLSPADLVRSVNKKVRQNYIRRKLMTTYKALERFSLSKCNLDTLGLAAAAAAAAASSSGRTKRNGEPGSSQPQSGTFLAVPGATSPHTHTHPHTQTHTHRSNSQTGLNTILKAVNKNKTLTVNDVERERGKPLSKYDRNIMIFNWLHALEPEEAYVEPAM